MRKQLSRGEWGVMSALWRAGRGASVDDVRSELATAPERDYRTIQTILHRCDDKGWVRIRRDGGRCYYTAAISHERGVEERAAGFFGELTEGDAELLERVRGVLERELTRLGARDRESGRRRPR